MRHLPWKESILFLKMQELCGRDGRRSIFEACENAITSCFKYPKKEHTLKQGDVVIIKGEERNRNNDQGK